MWNEQQSKRVGFFEVKGKTVQYQEKFLLQLLECSRQYYNTKIFNKDTMILMVVVIRGERANLHRIKSDEDYGRMIVDR